MELLSAISRRSNKLRKPVSRELTFVDAWEHERQCPLKSFATYCGTCEGQDFGACCSVFVQKRGVGARAKRTEAEVSGGV